MPSHNTDATPLLATDMDGTIVPPEASDERMEEVRQFRREVARGPLHLAYVTGRHLELALEGVSRFELPRPHVLGCDVGTTVYWWREGSFQSDREYAELVASTPGVAGAAAVQEALRGLEAVTLQEDEKQSEFKVSYYVDGVLGEELLEDISARLRDAGRTRLVASHDPVTGRSLLDVLPATVGKRTAVEHIARRLGLELSDVVYAGDSGNDRDALLSGMRAVVVGNAPDDLVAELRAEAAARGIEDRVFFARHRYARGVSEGLSHFRVPGDPGSTGPS